MVPAPQKHFFYLSIVLLLAACTLFNGCAATEMEDDPSSRHKLCGRMLMLQVKKVCAKTQCSSSSATASNVEVAVVEETRSKRSLPSLHPYRDLSRECCAEGCTHLDIQHYCCGENAILTPGNSNYNKYEISPSMEQEQAAQSQKEEQENQQQDQSSSPYRPSTAESDAPVEGATSSPPGEARHRRHRRRHHHHHHKMQPQEAEHADEFLSSPTIPHHGASMPSSVSSRKLNELKKRLMSGKALDDLLEF